MKLSKGFGLDSLFSFQTSSMAAATSLFSVDESERIQLRKYTFDIRHFALSNVRELSFRNLREGSGSLDQSHVYAEGNVPRHGKIECVQALR